MHDITVGIKEAKINLSRILDQVAAGAEVIITDRGRPVAKITRVSPSALSLEDRLAALERRGWIEPAKGDKASRIPPPFPVEGDLAQRFLREDREG
ncbi:MAG TPA: type II toxin-antitoxin system prevent-host-death family antitoxin [Firmicutes bacterium]|nr:type II toxin-antitoxin system prevent-host-death family antitoxin [Candidatus Fermentithermobacillaceae bacterium]